MTRNRRLFVLLALLGGCAEPDSMPLPDPPSPITRPEEYPFGDALFSAERSAVRAVRQQLEPRYGRATETSFLAPGDTDFGALRSWYDGRAAAANWQPIPDPGGKIGAGRNAFGYASEGIATVVVWPEQAAPDGSRPLTVIRFEGK